MSHLGGFLGRLGAFLDCLGALLGSPGATSGRLGTIWKPTARARPGGPKGARGSKRRLRHRRRHRRHTPQLESRRRHRRAARRLQDRQPLLLSFCYGSAPAAPLVADALGTSLGNTTSPLCVGGVESEFYKHHSAPSRKGLHLTLPMSGDFPPRLATRGGYLNPFGMGSLSTGGVLETSGGLVGGASCGTVLGPSWK